VKDGCKNFILAWCEQKETGIILAAIYHCVLFCKLIKRMNNDLHYELIVLFM